MSNGSDGLLLAGPEEVTRFVWLGESGTLGKLLLVLSVDNAVGIGKGGMLSLLLYAGAIHMDGVANFNAASLSIFGRFIERERDNGPEACGIVLDAPASCTASLFL
jgi:hypothetical protein